MTGPEICPVYVVVPPRVLLLDIAGPVEVLRRANVEQDRLCFAIQHVGAAAGEMSSTGLAVAGLAPLPASLPAGALVVVAGTVGAPLGPATEAETAAEAREAEIVAWLARVIRPGLRLISICSGALLAARAGLLDFHACTTHHTLTGELARLAPRAQVRENRLFVEDRDRLTSAGVTAGIDLMLHLVASRLGPGPAVAVARALTVYLRRAGADPQMSPWLDGRNHLHPAIHRAQDAITADPAHPWSVAALAALTATSPRTFSRLFNAQTGLSVTDYVNRLRVALAHELVRGSRLDLESVAERAGFASPRQLRRAWNRLHALPPSRLRQG